ncbi:MAG TPA: YkgJ family cysteine cluster protein [Candidatus Thermoplasmatota archaeon]|nr:YkgJ family cysteine cluster protein [Candidatus Thermoplasmatota archaeon]
MPTTPDVDPKERLFERLQGVYDGLDRLQEAHNRTPWGCKRSGGCCQVGLTLHYMECEWIARNLEVEFATGAKDRARVVAALEKAFDDPTWTNGNVIGSQWCALFDGGCSVYTYRPSICRMYGVVVAADEWCPRERLSNGRDFVYVDGKTDALVREYYRVLDEYGRRYKGRDWSVYYARGILEFLQTPREMRTLRARTRPRFWKREVGYRTQYKSAPKLTREVRKVHEEQRPDASWLKRLAVR